MFEEHSGKPATQGAAMTKIIFTAMAADEADAFRNGRPDANG
jgi:hypothetical protein